MKPNAIINAVPCPGSEDGCIAAVCADVQMRAAALMKCRLHFPLNLSNEGGYEVGLEVRR